MSSTPVCLQQASERVCILSAPSYMGAERSAVGTGRGLVGSRSSVGNAQQESSTVVAGPASQPFRYGLAKHHLVVRSSGMRDGVCIVCLGSRG
jgi:hypothetical protein